MIKDRNPIKNLFRQIRMSSFWSFEARRRHWEAKLQNIIKEMYLEKDERGESVAFDQWALCKEFDNIVKEIRIQK